MGFLSPKSRGLCKKVVESNFEVHLYRKLIITIITKNLILYIMKAQHTNPATKLAKKTVFVYKNIKAQSSYQTNPTGDQSHTVMTSFIMEF